MMPHWVMVYRFHLLLEGLRMPMVMLYISLKVKANNATEAANLVANGITVAVHGNRLGWISLYFDA